MGYPLCLGDVITLSSSVKVNFDVIQDDMEGLELELHIRDSKQKGLSSHIYCAVFCAT